MENFYKVLLILVFVVSGATYTRAQDNLSLPDTTNLNWIPYDGVINDIDTGEYYILFREIGANCLSNPDSFAISFQKVPVATITSSDDDNTIYAGDEITLTANDADSYLWNTGETTPSITVSPSTTQTYWLEVTQNGCTSLADSFKVTVFPRLAISTGLIVDATYYGANNGQITIDSITGGSGEAVQLLLDDKVIDSDFQAPLTIDTLSAGTHYLLATQAAGCSSDTLWFTIDQPQTFIFTAHVEQNETTSGAGDGIVVIDSIYAGQQLCFEYSKDSGITWSPVPRNDSLTGLSPDTLYMVLRTGKVYSDTLELVIERGCEPITFTVVDSTVCGDLTGTIVANGLDPVKRYEYLLIPVDVPSDSIIIELIGNKYISIFNGDTYSDEGAIATDTRYNIDISTDIVTVNNVNSMVPGTYTITYNVTAKDGYSAKEVVRTVIVINNLYNITGLGEVVIGTQTWTAKNLNVNDSIGNIYKGTFGCLYDQPTVLRIADSIEGWHLPTEYEFTTLYNYLGGKSGSAGKLKEVGTTHWKSPNTGATDEVGFTALPDGIYSSTRSGESIYTYYWTQTGNKASYFSYNSSYFSFSNITVSNLISVRLIKDYVHKPIIKLYPPHYTLYLGDSDVEHPLEVIDEMYGTSTTDLIITGEVDVNKEGIYNRYHNIIMPDGISADETVQTVTVIPETSETKIGTQIWSTMNLAINDGGEGIYCPNGDPDNVSKFGYLYTYEAALRVVSIIYGWHLPSNDEFSVLQSYVGGNQCGEKLRKVDDTCWKEAKTSPLSNYYRATNEFGFRAVGAGWYRAVYVNNSSPGFYGFNYSLNLWTSNINQYDEGYFFTLSSGNNTMDFSGPVMALSNNLGGANSIRLIKDTHTPLITLIGESTKTVDVGDSYVDQGATATDSEYGDITSSIKVVSDVDISTVGTYTVRYSVKTPDGCKAIPITRTVIVENIN